MDVEYCQVRFGFGNEMCSTGNTWVSTPVPNGISHGTLEKLEVLLSQYYFFYG